MKKPLLALLGPGLLVAATGVGAGDLATAAFSGHALGTACLWAVLVGAFLKFVLNEGVARWQLATGETLLAGALGRVARPWRLLFLVYLLPWSWFVGSALISACGVTGAALLPVFASQRQGQVVCGVVHTLLGIAIVRRGGFRLFERAMGLAIALMFVSVAVTALLLAPDLAGVARGLFVPSLPRGGSEGLVWTMALIGGVGGTLTILCYGYWIREEGRTSLADLRLCRIDLACGYAVTGFFGVAMVVIGSTIEVGGSGAGLVVALAERLGERLGPAGRLAFLLGAWAAVFSSLLGVWQAVPLLFADFWSLYTDHEPRARDARDSLPYRLYLYGLGLVPLLGLFYSFRAVQRAYALVGACFLPLLALTLLVLNRRRDLLGAARNSPATSLLLLLILCLFAAFAAGWHVMPS